MQLVTLNPEINNIIFVFNSFCSKLLNRTNLRTGATDCFGTHRRNFVSFPSAITLLGKYQMTKVNVIGGFPCTRAILMVTRQDRGREQWNRLARAYDFKLAHPQKVAAFDS